MPRVQIVAEAQRLNDVDVHFDVVRGEIAQRRGHHSYKTVEDDLEHRQALVVDERAVDDGRDTLGLALLVVVEAEQAVDLVLVKDAIGSAIAIASVVVAEPIPLGCHAFFFGQILGVGRFVDQHLTY